MFLLLAWPLQTNLVKAKLLKPGQRSEADGPNSEAKFRKTGVDRGGSKQVIDLKQAIGAYRSSNKKTISVRPSLLLPGFAAARHCSAWATNAVCS